MTRKQKENERLSFMKKYICGAALSAALLTSSALASAAANPFSDVPADHWAYDAVAQLADDGVIEGYGDGTYRGQNEITRYEMAQMVAKAMAKEDHVNAQQKAMIDRLAAEFAEELGNLGVRVDNLEQRIDNVRWGGEMRYVHLTHRDENAAGSTDENTVNLLQLRLLPVATINDHWKVRARLTGTIKLKEDTVSNGGSVALSYIYADGNYGKLRIQAGKMLHFLSYSGDGIVADSWFSGAILTYGDKTETTQVTKQQQTQIYFDDTRISGSYEVSARAESQSQTFTFNAQGFYASERVTVLLKSKSDSSICYTLGELTVDANGNLTGSLPAPADAPDGEYVLVLIGSHHSETATSQTVTTVSHHTFTVESTERSTTETETTENNNGGDKTTEHKTSENNGGIDKQAGGDKATEQNTSENNGGGDKTTERQNTEQNTTDNNGGDKTTEHKTTENNGGGSNGGSNSNANAGNKQTGDDKQANAGDNKAGADKGSSLSSNAKESSSDNRAGGETTKDSDESLAHTGANGMVFGGIAAFLVVAGGAALVLRRRNKA